MFGVIAGSVAFAQDLTGVDPVGFVPASNAELGAPVLVWRSGSEASPLGAGRLLVLGSSDAPDLPAGSLVGVGRGAVTEGLSLGVAASLNAGGGAFGSGDLHLSFPMVHGAVGAFTLGSVPFFDVPVGGAEWSGAGGGGLRLTAGASRGPWRLDANAGLRAAPVAASEGVRTGSAALAAIAGTWTPAEVVSVVVEAEARPAFVASPVPVEGVASLHLGVSPRVALTLGGAAGTGAAAGVAAVRGFVGVGWVRPRVLDRDGDGFLGPADVCPDQAETPNGFEDTDGCPELPASVAVRVVGFLDLPLLDADVALEVPPTWSEGATFTGRITHPAYDPFELPALPLFPGRTTLTVPMMPLPGQILFTAVDGLGQPIDAELSFSPPIHASFSVGPDGRETARIEAGQYVVFARAPGKAIERRTVFVGPAEPLQLDFVLHDELLKFVDDALDRPLDAFFGPDGEVLLDEGKPLLDQIANWFVDNADVARIEVRVPAQPIGDSAEALHQAQRRANNVAAHLYGRGVAWSRLVPKGVAEPGASAVVSFVILERAAP